MVFTFVVTHFFVNDVTTRNRYKSIQNLPKREKKHLLQMHSE